MAFRFFTVPIKDSATPEAELNAFLRSHHILAVERRWVDLGADSFWSLRVDYMETTSSPVEKSSAKKRHKDYKEVLNPEDFAVLARLRDLRKDIAQSEAVHV